jgi:excisionase family DNA binding protein
MSISLMRHQPRKPPASAASSDSSDSLDSLDLAARIEHWTSAMTVAELAHLIQVSHKQVYSLVAKRRIPSFRISGSIRLDPKRTADWLRSQAT